MLLAELLLWDPDTETNELLLVSEGGPVINPPGATTAGQFLPRIVGDGAGGGIVITDAVTISPYGSSAPRVLRAAGNLVIALDDDFDTWVSRVWLGGEARIFAGDQNGIGLAGILSVSNVSFDSGAGTVMVTLADPAVVLADRPLVTQMHPYPDGHEDNLPESLVGRPVSFLQGQLFNIAPTLINEPDNKWRVATTGVLSEVSALRVGGIPWDLVVGTPGGGQWSIDLSAGIVTLGSPSLGLDVRCDAKVLGWETCTTASLIRLIAEDILGMTVDDESLDALDVSVPGLVGFWTPTAPVHALDSLDTIARAAGCVITRTAAGLGAVPIAPPPLSSSRLLDGRNIGIRPADLTMIGMLEPIWRLRTFRRPNWAPCTSLAPSLTDDLKALYTAPGTFEPNSTDDVSILGVYPRAQDITFQTFFDDPGDALVAGNRLWNAWRFARRLYQVPAAVNPYFAAVYDDVEIDYGRVSGIGRAYEVASRVGGHGAVMKVWL